MIIRSLQRNIEDSLQRQVAVAIIGPRQVGKTTLAKRIAQERPSLYLDLEDWQDRARLDDPSLFFEHTKEKLVILDEVHRLPELFQTLRGVIDRGREQGLGTGRFLVLGSASVDLLRQSSETLAGRISYHELPPMQLTEVFADSEAVERLWLRGGFPGSLLAESEADSLAWRHDFVRTYLTREVSAFVGRMPAESLRRLWTMIANQQGSLINVSSLARALDVSTQSASRYLDLLIDLLLVRRLPPFHANVNKRLTKSPKIYIRDSGILHALLGISGMDPLLGNPLIGASWEGFVVEQLLNALPPTASAYFYRTAAGAEIDLVIEFAGNTIWAIEIKRTTSKVDRGFHEACEDIHANRRIVIHGSSDAFPLRHSVESMSLRHALDLLLHSSP